LFFTSPQKNILKTIGEGLGAIALSLVNNFTDVVSYIRLFAVGLAGVAIADAFNFMAYGVIKKGEPLTIIIAVLIIICGNALNIILGPMSILVHGVRLNVLEFCGHANVTWSGFVYKPFDRKEQ
jgi:V/A-type H+-transporting ATPase subunit I